MSIIGAISDVINSLPYIIDRIFPSCGYFKTNPGLEFELPDSSDTGFWREYNVIKDKAELLQETIKIGSTQHVKLPISRYFVKKLISSVNDNSDKGIDKFVRFNPLLFDIAYLFVTKFDGEKHRSSQYWHHDSVGDRLKIFLDLGSNTFAPTLVDYMSRPSGSSTQMSFEERLNYKPLSGNLRAFAPHSCETGIVLNTNYMHSGTSGDKGDYRLYLCIEFSNNLKFICRGRVGRRIKP